MTESIDISALIPIEARSEIDRFLTWAGGVVSFAITNDDENRNACELLLEASSAVKTLTNRRKETMEPYREAIYGAYRPVLDKLENLVAALKEATAKYNNEQEQKQIEAQRKLELEVAEARRKAEAEAEKLKAKAEAARAAGKEAVAERAEVKAQIAERTAAAIVAPMVDSAAKVAGVSYRKSWEVEITDYKKAVRGMAADPTLAAFLEINETKLKRHVANLGGDVVLPEGLRAYEDTVTTVRGKK
jgi:hypothetical protein